MPRVASFDLFSVDLPLRSPFRHAAAVRTKSDSLFIRCTTERGYVGWGECLPRDYVTGESRDGAFSMLEERILPHLVGCEFSTLADLEAFLAECSGQAPADWVAPELPQTAAWCAVDLALLDAFGHECKEQLWSDAAIPKGIRYSGVMSADSGFSQLRKALLMRLVGLRSIKLKVERHTPDSILRDLRRAFGDGTAVRADANMAWTADEAAAEMRRMARFGIRVFEQPVASDDIGGLAYLVRETGFQVMADESLSTRASLTRLIDEKACTAVNVRISKCGGLVAARQRCQEALDAGLTVQVGCQVGESSLLSAAHLALVGRVQQVSYAEGCFGTLAITKDPVEPMLRFGFGGRPPKRPRGHGLGVSPDEDALAAFISRRAHITTAASS